MHTYIKHQQLRIKSGNRASWRLISGVHVGIQELRKGRHYSLSPTFQTEHRNTSDGANRSRSQPTHVIYLTRFAPPIDSAPVLVSFEEHICNMLKSAPYQSLPLSTLQENMVCLGEQKCYMLVFSLFFFLPTVLPLNM